MSEEEREDLLGFWGSDSTLWAFREAWGREETVRAQEAGEGENGGDDKLSS